MSLKLDGVTLLSGLNLAGNANHITPPPNDSVAGLPIDFWSNLPLIACFTFAIVIIIGLIVIIRKNRQVADLHRKMETTNQQKEQ